MGGKLSKKIAEFEQELSYLDISRVEMKLLYKVFRKIATTKEQEYVTVPEVLKYAKIPYSIFAAKALCCGFCYVNETESEESARQILASFKFDYLTFVYALWNFLTLCPEAFTTFMFSMYDADGGGTIDPSEAQTLLKDLHGDDFGGNLDVIRQYNKFAMLVRKNINLERFHDFVADNQSILSPAVEIQDKLINRILGPIFWYVHTKKRKQLYLFNYKHVTRVVDKVRIMREKEMEQNWENGGKGNKKYAVNTNILRKGDTAKGSSQPPADILVLDDSSPNCDTNRKSTVSFALDVPDKAPSSPLRFMNKSPTGKYFFGSRPNTPSKQISYFLDKFYEKPGQVKVSADSKVSLTPYSLIKTGRAENTAAIPTVKAIVDSNFMVEKQKRRDESPSAKRLEKKTKKEEILKSITDVRSFARGQEFLEKMKAKEKPSAPPPVRKLTKAQTRLMKTKQKRDGQRIAQETID